MHARNLLPWNWHKLGDHGKKEVEIRRARSAQGSGSSGDLRQEMNRLLDAFFEAGPGPLFPSAPEEETAFLPPLEVENEPDELTVALEIPGLDEKDIEVSVDDDLLTIRGEKRSTREESRRGVRWSECRYGSFERGIPLPPHLDVAAARAEIRKGVLRVRIPKTTEARDRSRQIEIQAG